MADERPRRDAGSDATQPSVSRASDSGAATQLKGRAPVDATQITEKGDPTRVAVQTDQHIVQGVQLEKELLEELRRMNHQLAAITQGYRRYTLSFFSGVVRGLGAAIGATVVFAIFLAAISRLDTTPFIGNYVRRVVNVVHQSGPGGAGFNSSALNPFLDEETPTPAPVADATPDAEPAGSPTQAPTAAAPATATPATTPR